MPPAHAAKRTLNLSYSGIDSYRAASCVPVNGGTSHDLGSGSGGIGSWNGFDASNGIPVPNLSEHARFMMALSLWHMRGNTHSPSSCSPKYHLEITSGVICLTVMPPNTLLNGPRPSADYVSPRHAARCHPVFDAYPHTSRQVHRMSSIPLFSDDPCQSDAPTVLNHDGAFRPAHVRRQAMTQHPAHFQMIVALGVHPRVTNSVQAMR